MLAAALLAAAALSARGACVAVGGLRGAPALATRVARPSAAARMSSSSTAPRRRLDDLEHLDHGQVTQLVVPADAEAPAAVPDFLAAALGETMSTSRKLVRKGAVFLNGYRARCEDVVRAGDKVAVLPREDKAGGTGVEADEPRADSAFWRADGALPPAELLAATREQLGQMLGGTGRASIVWDCLRRGEDPMGAAGVSERAKGLLALAGLGVARTGALSHRTVTRDGTVKLLVRLTDGFEVETVLIPWPERGRTTICVSSQVGCAQGCTFCATGRMGRLRSLRAEEILLQAFYGRQTVRELSMPPLEGVVFMGMGEPADNADEVVLAARALGDDARFRFSRARVTISTVAPSPDSFASLARAGCVLAWSVHAADDGLRRRLVPTTRHSMVQLRDGLSEALLSLPKNARQCMIEVVLIEGVNDRPEDAAAMLDFLLPLIAATRHAKVMVDLIPYNAVDHADAFRKPSFERVRDYQRVLKAGGVFTFVRTTRGDDGDAACGQLATRRKAEAPAA